MRSALLALTLSTTLLLASCRSTAGQLPALPAESAFPELAVHGELTLGANDVLRVGVYGHPELSSLPHATTAAGTRIDGQGNLSLPLVGPVAVEGLTVAQAHVVITAAFAAYVQDPKIDVSVIEYGAREVFVYGEVGAPGAVLMDRPLNLYQCLALSGGFTSRADRSRIVLVRGTLEDLEVYVCDGENPSETGLVALRPDDLVFVRRSGAGKFAEEFLPILAGISSSLTSIGTLILIGDRLED